MSTLASASRALPQLRFHDLSLPQDLTDHLIKNIYQKFLRFRIPNILIFTRDTSNTTMDLEFASDPSHPDWEPPHSLQLVEMDVYEAGTTPSPHSVRTRRAEALESGTRQLIQLCSSEGLLSVLDEFLTSWHDPHHPDRLQPNALAWFQEAEAFGRAIENGREDAVQILAAHGIQPQRPDIWAALDVLERTRNRSALDLLLKGGWEIDRPVNENATSILG